MIVEFALNAPQTLALSHCEAYAFSDRFNNSRVRYNLTDGNVLFVDLPTSNRIRDLKLQAGETFVIVKRRDGRRNVWAVWLTPELEKARAAQEKPAIEAELRCASFPASIPAVSFPGRKGVVLPMPDPKPEVGGTGTYGAAPRLAAGVRVPEKIPVDVAFREIVRFVNEGLEQSGEVWNDKARQAIVSTVLIAADKLGWLTTWERPAA